MSTIDKLKAKVDNVLHKDKSHTDTTHTGTGVTGSHSTTGTGVTGSHGTTGSGLTGSHGTTGTTGGLGSSHGSDPTGPHDSRLANKADPRVDSDRIGTAGNTSGAGGYGAGQYGSNTHGTTGGLSSTTHGTSGHSDPTGPHDSRLANKADPRVDSDRYGTAGNTSGAGGYGAGQYGSNTHGTTGGLSSTTHGTSGYSDPTGPHDSHLANKADPRVDSDRYGTAGNTAGAGGHGTGQYGSGTTGGLTGSGTHGTTSHTAGNVGSGNSSTTAGPHDSNFLNKVDPRVDSDLDGSKTVGQNQTYR